MENTNKVERSELWNDIYGIVNQIPRKEVDGDAVDAPSATTSIEQLISSYKIKAEKWNKSNPLENGGYICRMNNAYIKMCYWNVTEWFDMWKNTLEGIVIEWMHIPYDELLIDENKLNIDKGVTIP